METASIEFDAVLNAFCPGEGARDNSCSSRGGSGANYGYKSYVKSDLEKKIKEGLFEATEDIKPGRHVQIRSIASGKLATVYIEPTDNDNSSFEQLVANISARPQRRTLDGREYLVAPITIFPPGGGVMNGSKGALYYSDPVCKSRPGAWNDVPITGRHPVRNGKHVSAAGADDQRIGFLANDHVENGRRRVYGWLDVENAREYDARNGTTILPDWEAGKLLEVSTGLLTDDRPVENGTHNGRAYAREVVGWTPDHLAVLPDQRGACDIKMGCGVNNASAESGKGKLREMWEGFGRLLGFNAEYDDKEHHCAECDGKPESEHCDKCKEMAANVRSLNTGKFKPKGSGFGRGEQHEGAQRGAMMLTERDYELGEDAFRELTETGNNPASWVADEAKWERAKKAADGGGYAKGSRYWAVVSHIYKNMGGAVKTEEKTANEFGEIVNAFCPGEGAQDNSCSSRSGKGGKEKDRLEKARKAGPSGKSLVIKTKDGYKEYVEGGTKSYDKSGKLLGFEPDQYLHEKRFAPKPVTKKTDNESGNPLDDATFNEGDFPVKLNERQRRTIIDELTENCECWAGGEETLNDLSDDRLLALAKAHKAAVENEAIAAAVADVLDPPETVTANAMPAFIKRKMKAAKMADDEDEEDEEDEDEETENEENDVENEDVTDRAPARRRSVANAAPAKPAKTPTLNDWLADPSVPVEVKNSFRFAANKEREDKRRLVDQLVANVADDAMRRRLADRKMKLSINELEDELALLSPSLRQRPMDSGAPLGLFFGEGGATANAADDIAGEVALMEPPALNFDADRKAATA